MVAGLYEYLVTRINFDFDTGGMTWKNNPTQKRNWNHRMEGKNVGTVAPNGYIRIKVYFNGKAKIALGHRLMFFAKYCYLPAQIDHVNRVRSDNRISNLRDSSDQTNSYNKGLSSINTSGYKGVNWHKMAKKWCARIGVKHERICVGFFESKEDAFLALEAKRKELHGNFATIGI